MPKAIGEFPSINIEHDITGEGTTSQLIEALLKLGQKYSSATEIQIVKDGKVSSGLRSKTHGPLQDIDLERRVIYMFPRYLAQPDGNFIEEKGSVRHGIFDDAQVKWVIHQPQN